METLKKPKTTKFKPQFLYRSERKAKAATDKYLQALMSLNKLIDEAESVLSRELTKDEKYSLYQLDSGFVFDEIKSKYPMPKADESFNLRALGIDLKPYREALNAAKVCNVSSYEFLLTGKRFDEDKEYIKELEKTFDIYTQNEKQNEALALSKQMIELLNKFKEKKYCFTTMPVLTMGNPIIAVGDNSSNVPFYDSILKIK